VKLTAVIDGPGRMARSGYWLNHLLGLFGFRRWLEFPGSTLPLDEVVAVLTSRLGRR
jgi:hypothetical protein